MTNHSMNHRTPSVRRATPVLILCLLAWTGTQLHAAGASGDGVESLAIPAPHIGRVFFAQQHVLEPTSPYFKLVGHLEALVKVQVYADAPVKSPNVFAVLELDGRNTAIRLRGPEVLPKPYAGDPVLMPQSYDESFTATIPREWVQPGLKVGIELREYDYTEAHDYDRDTKESTASNSIHVLDRKDLGTISVGAPSTLTMNMFDIHYFGLGRGADHPTGWEEEFKARYPISEFTVHRVRDIVFDKIVWMPRSGLPSVLCTSPEDYEKKTGQPIDGEQAMALAWGSALKRAAGVNWNWRLYYINICGMQAGGQARGFLACGSIHRNGVILHEVGHTLGLPHCPDDKNYPYCSTLYGLTPGTPDRPNAGPTWGYDLNRRVFLQPYVKTDAGTEWTKDPMLGGGRYPGNEFIYRHFSDYNVHKMQTTLETRTVFWNDDLKQYARWNPDTAAYDRVIENDGLQFPIERDAQVVSLLVTANLVLPDANIIYSPIGPYTAGLIQRFDVDTEDGRKLALKFGYDQKGSNVCLRVTQGGKTSTYLLDIELSENDNPLQNFNVSAINLPARDGNVSRVELLYTPDVVTRGVGTHAKVLAVWSK
ncbi:MAG: hypothetical protein GC164_01345 [Phycisphaera sp.]|nr:hypothetical protein [Phycisphaera sp.]